MCTSLGRGWFSFWFLQTIAKNINFLSLAVSTVSFTARVEAAVIEQEYKNIKLVDA